MDIDLVNMGMRNMRFAFTEIVQRYEVVNRNTLSVTRSYKSKMLSKMLIEISNEEEERYFCKLGIIAMFVLLSY
jgi:uncharacterized protein YqfB (UPF0267 family)